MSHAPIRLRPTGCAALLLALALLAGCAGTPSTPSRSLEATLSEQQDLSIERVLAISFARDALGIPYRYGGTTREGMDCSGLTQASLSAAGITIPRTSQQQYDALPAIDSARPGDLLFFGSGGRISHVGLYVGDHRMIHAPGSGRQVSVANLGNRYWRSHFHGAAAPAP